MKSGLAEEVDALHRRIASAHWGDFFVMVVVGEDSSCVQIPFGGLSKKNISWSARGLRQGNTLSVPTVAARS